MTDVLILFDNPDAYEKSQSCISVLRQLGISFSAKIIGDDTVKRETNIKLAVREINGSKTLQVILLVNIPNYEAKIICEATDLPIVGLLLSVEAQRFPYIGKNLPIANITMGDVRSAGIFIGRMLAVTDKEVSQRLQMMKPENRLKNAAKTICESITDAMKDQMQLLWENKEYRAIINIAAEYDIAKREQLDDKISMQVDGSSLIPTFKSEGIEEIFYSASEAIEAYKKLNKIKTPDQSKHQFKSAHLTKEDNVQDN
ncbi:hypothetical protein LCGC14_2061050 [marine sediment metagenome]|uniref:Uncharacterized protein n=1 Tax=marine sediment metagenome TaxID=412755 RepID=A0A0F9GZP6_9ZZZZ